MIDYLARLRTPLIVLWCYVIWYAVVVAHHFDASPRLWTTSLGLSLIIGVALVLNASSGSHRQSLAFWPRLRFFLAPFCVSSFSALVKGKGFWLVFSPRPREVAEGLVLCAAFVAVTRAARKYRVQ